ncbi:MAG: nucleotidyl transferase AbiEii/AbiGii toxin family protein [Thermoplasmata archaeon]|nr:nucleotidyl transferase AbiEii/AbiGii toxin family protein [Thermoplasmata archaeon]
MSQRGEFLQRLNRELRPRRPDIIEKDFHLHRLLNVISRDECLSRNLAFKGGTCLIKAYLGYYRFSEDIDFTWRNRSILEDVRSTMDLRRRCSRMTDDIIGRLVPIADRLGFDFKGVKSERDEVAIGSGGRMPRFYLGYRSEIVPTDARIKMEVNFVDLEGLPCQTRELRSYIEGYENRELQVLFPEQYGEYTARMTMTCYDHQDIFTDKCRAALTRATYKVRDILDIIYLEDRFGLSIGDLEDSIVEKTRFMVESYDRYHLNIRERGFPDVASLEGEEMQLLIEPPPEGLYREIERVHGELEAVRSRLTSPP